MFKLIICAALVSTFLVTVSCEEAATSSKSVSENEDEDEKSEQVCPDNEIYDQCPPVKCDAEYCPKSRDDALTCPTSKKCGTPRCTCAFNTHRDRETGKCIPTRDCPPFECDGPNEQYDSCPPGCPSENCSDYISNKTCGPPLGTRIGIVVPCKPQCRCKEGFYRNSDNVCVKPKDCTQKCPKNEVYSTCIQGQCQRKNCTQLGKPIACPRINPKYCIKGCICTEGYLRNKNGKCIPQDKCPEAKGCGGDSNAVKTDCGTYCGHSCSDYNKTDVICTKICNTNGCSCKKNYVYDPNKKKCVLPEDCSLQCTGLNEIYNSCAPSCPPQTCATIGIKFSCIEQPAPGNSKCKEGCRCKSGYYRDFQNVCVEKSDCLKCTKPNEVYDSCSWPCPPNTCESIGRQYKCPVQPVPGDSKCVGKCRCKKGFYRNSKGECVSESDCKKYKTTESSSDESEEDEDTGTTQR